LEELCHIDIQHRDIERSCVRRKFFERSQCIRVQLEEFGASLALRGELQDEFVEYAGEREFQEVRAQSVEASANFRPL